MCFKHLAGASSTETEYTTFCSRAHVVCCKLTHHAISLPRSKRFNQRLLGPRSTLSGGSNIDIMLSDIQVQSDVSISSVTSKGTYSVMVVSVDCVIILGRNTSSGRLVPAVSSRSQHPSSTVHFLVGYLSNDTFNVLFCYRYTRTSGNTKIDWSVNSMFEHLDGIRVQACSVSNGLLDNWRRTFCSYHLLWIFSPSINMWMLL